MKSVVINVLPQPGKGHGYARIQIQDPDLRTLADQSRFSIQRNQDGRFLTEDGNWESTETWHSTPDTQVTENTLSFEVGPSLMDTILADTRSVCKLHFQSDSQSIGGVLRLASGLYPSNAAKAMQPDPQPIAEPVAIEEVKQDVTPVAQTDSQPRSKALPVLLALLLMAIAGIGAWYYFTQGTKEPTIQESTPAPPQLTTDDNAKAKQSAPPKEPSQESSSNSEQAAPASAAAPTVLQPCSSETLEQSKDELAYLQACTQTKPSTQQIIEVIEAGKKNNRCDLIQRLYAYEAQRGNTDIALRYAQEFDPETFKGGCFKQADKATAIYWYELVLQQQPDNQRAIERMKALKEMP